MTLLLCCDDVRYGNSVVVSGDVPAGPSQILLHSAGPLLGLVFLV